MPDSKDYDSIDYNRRIGEPNLAAYDVNDKIEAIVRESQDRTGIIDFIYATGVRVSWPVLLLAFESFQQIAP